MYENRLWLPPTMHALTGRAQLLWDSRKRIDNVKRERAHPLKNHECKIIILNSNEYYFRGFHFSKEIMQWKKRARKTNIEK
jgi:hypothetical protein